MSKKTSTKTSSLLRVSQEGNRFTLKVQLEGGSRENWHYETNGRHFIMTNREDTK